MRNRKTTRVGSEIRIHPIGAVFISVGVSAIVTLLLLLLLTILIYNTKVSATLSGILMVAVYVLGPFSGAMVLGKLVKKKRYLWGLLLGIVYFLVFLVISLSGIVTAEEGMLPGVRDYIKVLLAVLPGGILGGMFS